MSYELKTNLLEKFLLGRELLTKLANKSSEESPGNPKLEKKIRQEPGTEIFGKV